MKKIILEIDGMTCSACSNGLERYLNKQNASIKELQKLENKLIPDNIDYSQIDGLRLEARQKLNKVKPLNLGQASRISGVSPADITVLMVYLFKK